MKERLRLILVFYSSFAGFTGITSAALWGLADFPLHQKFWRFLPLYILLKIATDGLICWYVRHYSPDRMFFYFNKGISERTLFLSAFVVDILLFLVLMLLINMMF